MAAMDDLLEIIAEEMGMDRDELSDDTDITELGRDTPLSRMFMKRIPDTLRSDINSATFQGCVDVADLKEHISRVIGSRQSDDEAGTSSSAEPPKQLVLHLQGNVATATKNVFLLPDGSGSGMAYMAIPPLDPSICAYGLDSPYLNATEGFGGSFDDLIPRWAEEIRNVQPHGPYILGGWSAGGYFAFELAKLFLDSGENVEKLILIDSPCRLKFEALPTQVVKHLARHNLMGNWNTSGTPKWLVNSFTATISAVEKYMPTPMKPRGPSGMPKVFIIWASEGVFPQGTVQPDLDLNVKVTKFLVEQRTEFGPLGWEKLFPGQQLSIAKTPGNHFMIVHPPFVSTHICHYRESCSLIRAQAFTLGQLLQDAVINPHCETKRSWHVYPNKD